ncbi:MAG TPA: flagellar basal body protein [Zeimonas sp.]
MLERLTGTLQFQGEALALRAQRQQVLASNIANADTPSYQARDFDFGQALAQAAMRIGDPSVQRASVVSSSGSSMRVAFAAPDAAGAAGVAGTGSPGAATADKAFLPLNGSASSSHPALLWRTPQQPSLDRNSVDLDRERADFADNSLRYEATLRFINGNVRNVLAAIRGE